MAELRQKMIRVMELKNLSNHTQRSYLAAVKGIARFYKQSPEKMTKEEIEDYLLYLKRDKGNAPNSCCAVRSGLRFFYKNVAEIGLFKHFASIDYWGSFCWNPSI